MTSADASRLRDELADQLVAGGLIKRAAIERAFREVPRHVFLAGVELAVAYADEAVVTDRDSEGRPISASSQPSMMALMLEQLGLRHGDRVLEIGAGTGYNAALLAYLVGEHGSVVTVDIDERIVGRARRNLDEAGPEPDRSDHPGYFCASMTIAASTPKLLVPPCKRPAPGSPRVCGSPDATS